MRRAAGGGEPREGNPIRGLAALLELWNSFPVRRVSWRLAGLPREGLARLNDDIRGRCWREFCAAKPRICADRYREPRCVRPRQCLARSLYPMPAAPAADVERTDPADIFLATVHCRWRPGAGVLDLWLLGAPALAAEPVVIEEIGKWLGGPLPAESRGEGSLESLLSFAPGDYRMDLVTPWILPKTGSGQSARGEFAQKLREGLCARATKLTNTVIAQTAGMAAAPLSVRMLLGFGAERIVREACDKPGCLEVVADGTHDIPEQSRESRSRGTEFSERLAQGWAQLRVDREGSRLLPLLAVLAAGDSADKGYNSVELRRADWAPD